jgi:membrane fusion protein (multidrug efflux system)
MWRRFVAVSLLIGLMETGCRPQQQAPPPQTPEVAVVTVQPEAVTLTTELPGRTSAYLVAEIRPQVNGLLQKRFFTEGTEVKKDDVLYQIDPAPYQAALDNANANLLAAQKAADQARAALAASNASLQRHEATLKLAKANLQRYENLVKSHAISEMQRDQAVADVDVADAALRTANAQIKSDEQAVGAAEAAIKQAEAALQTARINLDYTKITAPIDGRIGRSHVTEGAIVTAYQPVPLAVIQQFNPIYVDVPQSTAEVNRLRQKLTKGDLKDAETDKVKITLEDDSVYPQEGSLKFRDVTVDPTTGSIILRIVVPNPDNVLLPGMFVRATIDEGVNDQAILLPQQAVSRDPKGNPMAWIVDGKSQLQPRPLTTDRAIGDRWLVSSGLAPGDQVVVEGILKAMMARSPQNPDVTVKAVPFQAGGTAAAKPEGTAQTALH